MTEAESGAMHEARDHQGLSGAIRSRKRPGDMLAYLYRSLACRYIDLGLLFSRTMRR